LREHGDGVIFPSSGWANRCVSYYTRVIWEEDERDIKRLHIGASTLTVSQKAVDAFNEIGGHATLLPKFPLKSEVEKIIYKNTGISRVFI